MDTITKRMAKEGLGVTKDAELARILGITPAAVSQWGKEDDEIPVGKQWELRARFPKLFPIRYRAA